MKNFWTGTLWQYREAEMNPVSRSFIHFLRTIVLTWRCFTGNDCALRASALTFCTLLSLVPVAALAFAVAKGFNLDEILRNWIMNSLKEYPEVASKLIDFSVRMLDGAKGGIIAGAGIAILLYATIRLMMQVEKSFNEIWGAPSGRSFLRKISDYLAFILLAPLLIGVSTSAAAFAARYLPGTGCCCPPDFLYETVLIQGMTHLVPVCTGWLIFTLLFIFIPNTRVQVRPALWGALITSLLCHGVQILYVEAQFMAGRYNAIYGGFAAFPLFLIWLQLSWTFILLGLSVTCACQTAVSYEGSGLRRGPEPVKEILCALRILRACALEFESMNRPLSAADLSRELEIPERYTDKIIENLQEAGLLSEVITRQGESAWQVAVPPEKLTIALVLRRLQERGALEEVDTSAPVYAYLSNFWNSASELSQNAPLIRINI